MAFNDPTGRPVNTGVIGPGVGAPQQRQLPGGPAQPAPPMRGKLDALNTGVVGQRPPMSREEKRRRIMAHAAANQGKGGQVQSPAEAEQIRRQRAARQAGQQKAIQATAPPMPPPPIAAPPQPLQRVGNRQDQGRAY